MKHEREGGGRRRIYKWIECVRTKKREEERYRAREKKNKKKRWWLEGRECTKSIAEEEKGTEGCRQQEKNSRDDSR